MPNTTPEKETTKPVPLFDLFHVIVCLVVVGYYLLKFGGASGLSREGEFVLNTILLGVIAIKFFRTLNKNKRASGEDQ